uniref:DNA-directed DNA polymerase n=1 Tax=Globodera pallida TaxID=36090 RepID=A0A183BTT1_GLOPA
MGDLGIDGNAKSYGIGHLAVVQAFWDKEFPDMYRIVAFDLVAGLKPVFKGKDVRKYEVLPNKDALTKVFSSENFTKKYRHFVIISCIVGIAQHIVQFCLFVERKIRLQLAHFDKIMDKTVEYGHVMPTKELAIQNKCPATLDVADFTNRLESKLVGLEELEQWDIDVSKLET